MRSTRSRVYWLLICALLLSLIFPIAAGGQGRWSRGYSRHRPVVVYNYQPRAYGVYRTRPYNYRPGHYDYYRRPSYEDRYYQTYGYWYAPIRRRHSNRFRLNLRW